MLTSLSIRRLGIATSAVAVICAILSLGSVLLLSQISKQAMQASDNRYHSYLLADELRQSSDDLTRLARTYVVTADPTFESHYQDILAIREGEKPRPAGYTGIYWDLVAAGRPVSKETEPARSLISRMKESGFTAREFALLNEARRNGDSLVALEVEAMNAVNGLSKDDTGSYTLIGEPDTARARALLHSKEYHGLKADVMTPMNTFFKQLNARLDGTRDRLQHQQDMMRMVAIVMGALSMLAAVSAAVMLLVRVLRPLTLMRNAMKRMGEGDLSQPVPLIDRRCEIGQIAREAENFRLQASETVRLSEEVKQASEQATLHAKETMELSRREQARMADERATAEKAARFQGEVARVVAAAREGDLSVRAAIEHDYPVGAEIGGGLNDLLDAIEGTFEEISGALSRIAEGDLSIPVEQQAAGQIGAVLTATEAARLALTELVAQTRHNAESVVELASSIDRAARDMSIRTESNAATLEESSAALTELTASVRSAAEGAERADKIGRGTREEAEQSNAVVTDAIAAMGQIEASSKKISTIISVIEGIAFQTNLLALNAGVEAARAGEAGRGFAVVASEVRALAQRSSAAASEINTLISQSTQQVSRGADLVSRTGEALQRILASVGDISSQISAIALSAREQSTGISEINTAVHQLDQATQANAAMVSETSESTSALSHEAQELREAVARFILEGDPVQQRPEGLRLAG